MAAVVGAGYLAAQEDATRPAGYGHRLALVRDRGKVLCADNTELAAWSWIDENGKNRGFGPDYCRAYAAAVFGDATDDNWEIVNITFAERPTVMQSGEIDVMTIANTWTAHREIHWGNFVDIVHYAGLGVVSSKDSGIMANDWQSLDGMTGCTGAGTNYVQMAADMEAEYGITFELALYEIGGVRDAYDAGRCDFVLTGSDGTGSFVRQLTRSTPDDHSIWTSVFGKDPWAMLVPHGDDQWFDLVRMVGWILLNAEELGVTQDNVQDMYDNSSEHQGAAPARRRGHLGPGSPADRSRGCLEHHQGSGQLRRDHRPLLQHRGGRERLGLLSRTRAGQPVSARRPDVRAGEHLIDRVNARIGAGLPAVARLLCSALP